MPPTPCPRPTPAERAHHAHVRELVDHTPRLRDTGWEHALAATPRSGYAPAVANPSATLTPDGPNADAYWSALAATGDLSTPAPDGRVAAWAPALGFAALLTRLEPRPGQRVLVVGARGGWEAAVIAAHPARPDVVVCESTPSIGAEAANRLAAARSRARVEIADAHHRLPAGRWDHVVVTGTTDHIPVLWTRALRPGGRLLTSIGQALAVVDRDTHGTGAHGRFEPLPAAFGPWDHPDRVGDPLLTEHGAHGFDLFAYLPPPTRVASVAHLPRGAHPCGDTALGMRYGAHVALGRPRLNRFTLTAHGGRTLVTLTDEKDGRPVRMWDLTPPATRTDTARRGAA
ncbi:hypothetical protein OG948_60370 (plasmid) [Embleya sp. NBC_00888]|uniref:hypothetical protein n=1 Tax=Embleya sp. NBC_00888 TaxID=2975960 RepID=UPI003866AD59|nr:hypothetical protein OG948_60370 [Embleya sp. NBC_00888]